MDSVVVTAFVAVLAIGLALSLAVAWSRGRQLDDVRDALRAALGSAGGSSSARDRASGARDGARTVDAADDVRRLRQRAESAEFGLDQRLRDLAYLADLVGVGIVRLTDDLQVEVANVAAHVFLGREPGSMVGRTAIEALVDHRIEDVARRARDVGSAIEEVEPRGPDSARLIVRARRSPILGVWLVLQDVAELRRLQRIRAEFVDNLSHELRTPITTIGLLTETLARDAEAADASGRPVPERMKDRIGKLEIEIGNVGQMIAELLDLARIESGGPQLHLDDVDLGEVARQSVDRLRAFAERHSIELETVELPAAALAVAAQPTRRGGDGAAHARQQPLHVRGEAAQLGRLVTNLVHNAVKFSPRGSTVRVELAGRPEAVELRVIDHGSGIDPADQDRIFERFYKADQTRTSGGGTGLGLAIARHIVEGHGGTITVESTAGVGSTFIVRLPSADQP